MYELDSLTQYYTIAVRLVYVFHDWPIFFINNSITKYKKFLQRKILFEVILEIIN